MVNSMLIAHHNQFVLWRNLMHFASRFHLRIFIARQQAERDIVFFASVRHIAVLFLNERNAHIVNVFPPSRCDMTLVTRPTRSIARYLLRQRGWVAG